MNQKLNNRPSNVRPATSAQLTKLRDWYEYSIGYCNAMWYVGQLREQKKSIQWASREMDRLAKLRLEHGPSAMKPLNWEYICPSEDTVKEYMENLRKRSLNERKS